MRLVATVVLAASSFVPDLAAADTCAPARAMVVLDKSSSMVTGFIGAETKWDVAVAGLGQVLGAYEAKAEFGLMTFPKPSQCGPGGLEVSPAMANKSAILAALATPPPNAGNWTPMAQTLLAAADEPSLLTAPGTKHVILVTDGWQWCSPYDPTTRYDGTDAVAALDAKGVTTWIVGFGAEVDASALNQMAVVAGTQKPNCNPQGSDPAAADNCYFQVDNAQQLVAALTAISSTIVADELCDGIDNDCDGQIDEALARDCSNACGGGQETCSAGVWGACSAPAATSCATDDTDDDDTSGTETGEEMHAGCVCDAGGAPSGATLFFAFGVMAVALRRRRR